MTKAILKGKRTPGREVLKREIEESIADDRDEAVGQREELYRFLEERYGLSGRKGDG